VFDAACIVVDQGRKMLVDGATHNKKKEFHEQKENEERTEKYRGSGEGIEGMREWDRGRTRRRRAEKTPKNETLLLETRSFRAEGLCRGHAAPPFSVPHYDFPHKTGGRQA